MAAVRTFVASFTGCASHGGAGAYAEARAHSFPGAAVAAGVPPEQRTSTTRTSSITTAGAALLAFGVSAMARCKRRQDPHGRERVHRCWAGVMRRAARRPCHGGEHLSPERKAELELVCKAICTPGKGITATDEGPGTIGGRFEVVGVSNSEENRRLYRQMLYKTEGINEYLSAAILDPETMYQKDDAGTPFPEVLSGLGIIPGVKPHLKVYVLPGTGGDTVMQGLDSLAARCKEYRAAGMRFAKWRSPLAITPQGCPTELAISSNMVDLARYALICQDEGLVPIVEPDIVMKGDHSLETSVAVNTQVQSVLYKAMLDHGVYLEGTVLKTNLVNPGVSCPTSYSVKQIADANLTVLRRVMPAAIRGVNFLSGGQRLEDAAARLNAVNQAKADAPWNLSFSWSWALQAPLLELCRGKGGQLPLQEMGTLYLKELSMASAAALGRHEPKPGEGDHLAP